MQPVIALLLDPYRGGGKVVTAGEIIDRAALAECRAAQWAKLLDPPGSPGPPHGLRWQFGRPAACADHLQDAIHAGRQIGVL
jgi:hypothetical protein